MSAPYAGRLGGWSWATVAFGSASFIFFLACPPWPWRPLVLGVLLGGALDALCHACYWLGRSVEHNFPNARGDVRWSIYDDDSDPPTAT